MLNFTIIALTLVQLISCFGDFMMCLVSLLMFLLLVFVGAFYFGTCDCDLLDEKRITWAVGRKHTESQW